MIYYILLAIANLIPEGGRRQRFIASARARFSLRAIVDAALTEQRVTLENAIYRAQMSQTPIIMTVDQTLDALVEGMSIARFGAGDLGTMEGKFDVFQTPSAELSRRLREVLTSDEPGLLVGIPAFTYDLGTTELSEGMRDYLMRIAPFIRPVLGSYLTLTKTYAATEVSLAHTAFHPSYDRQSYFERFRRIWEGARVTLIHGDGIFDGFRHDIFDNAIAVDHVLAPKQDAFDEYDDILARALQTPKDSLIVLVLGPTATVLAYDLYRTGYRVLDLGHIAKSYEWWRNGKTIVEQGASDDFFGAD
ncbi:GT-D fold domain-containing glycosyltransferase [Humibacter sp. RRB41]|uniref:GT-D fold domain-containing glycosyltransferase n=1 Tax=Humibacter sp. RRB41 TaxID=2919946 RepID=UPI001FAA5CC6|nr:GT-D fold domain-containing glycosyltransferase [Humibacter sp. RRB41]